MSQTSTDDKKKKRKPLLPLEKTTFVTGTPVPISLEEIDSAAELVLSQAQETVAVEEASMPEQTVIAPPLPELQHMDDDELPFVEQPHIPISEADLAQLSVAAEEVQKLLAEQELNQSDDHPSAQLDRLPDAPPLPELQPMDDDELPFLEQSYTPISLDELDGVATKDKLPE
ncbi:MAG: hypothetical protein Q4G42_09960 [Neisseria sp.]|nr:hypothetical protein [Neisseria sp.]